VETVRPRNTERHIRRLVKGGVEGGNKGKRRKAKCTQTITCTTMREKSLCQTRDPAVIMCVIMLETINSFYKIL